MKIIQLTSSMYDNHLGLYQTERDDDKVSADIEDAFALAIEEAEQNDELSPHDIADEYLESKGIVRVFADEVYISNI